MPLHVMIDIEALGKASGSAIIEIGAIAFDSETRKLGERFHIRIQPEAPFTIDADTLYWHEKQGSWPVMDGERVAHSMNMLAEWFRSLGTVDQVWAWGSDYDFPILEAAFRFCGYQTEQLPWKYYQVACARTVWKLAFPNTRHAARPHRAIEDCIAAINDLFTAVDHLQGKDAA